MSTHMSRAKILAVAAVLAVIIFHAGYKQMAGGFIGVDIFFVISGYLITTILYNDLDRGSFSILPQPKIPSCTVSSKISSSCSRRSRVSASRSRRAISI